MAEPLSAFAGAQQRTEEQKKALLQAIAEGGSAGSQLMQQQLQAQEANRQQAIASQAQPGFNTAGGAGFAQQISGIINQPFDLAAQMASTAQEVFNQDIARQQAAAGQFLTQVQQALPLEESRARSVVEQLVRQQQQEDAARAQQLALGQLELQAQREQIAAAREARAGGGRDPLEQRALELDIARAQMELGAFQSQQQEAKENALFGDIITQFAGGNPNSPVAIGISRVLEGEKINSVLGDLKSSQILGGMSEKVLRDLVRKGVVAYRKRTGQQPAKKTSRFKGQVGFGRR